MMIDFGKRRGENIILFAEKEFKPEGRGRGGGLFGWGGALLLILVFFCKAGEGGGKAGGGEYYCLGARWADGEGGGRGRL